MRVLTNLILARASAHLSKLAAKYSHDARHQADGKKIMHLYILPSGVLTIYYQSNIVCISENIYPYHK